MDYSLLPDELNFLFWQGDTVNIQYTVVDTADDPINLTSYTSIRAQLRNPSGTIVTDLTIIPTGLAVGEFQTFLDQEVSAQLSPGVEYPYDIQLESTKTIVSTPEKTIATIARGFYKVSKEATLEAAPGLLVYQQAAPEQQSHTLRRRGL